MAIYRGAGGAGDATGDAASEAALATTKAAEAAASALAAASSADDAASSADEASDSAASAASYVDVALLKTNNLSDLVSASTARTNLGLGTAATTAATAYATAAQGAKADSAVQTETDPIYVASSWYGTTNNSSNWNTAYGWGNHASAGYSTYPSQTGNNGKYLTTNGSTTSWASVDALPSQTGNSGKYLTTDGSTSSWATLNTDSNSTTKGLYEMSNTISANYSITSGNNAVSAGPVSIASGVTVTVPSGSVWTVV